MGWRRDPWFPGVKGSAEREYKRALWGIFWGYANILYQCKCFCYNIIVYYTAFYMLCCILHNSKIWCAALYFGFDLQDVYLWKDLNKAFTYIFFIKKFESINTLNKMFSVHNNQRQNTIKMSSDGRINKMRGIHTVEILLGLKKEWIPTHATMWMNLEDTMQSEVRHTPNTICFQL